MSPSQVPVRRLAPRGFNRKPNGVRLELPMGYNAARRARLPRAGEAGGAQDVRQNPLAKRWGVPPQARTPRGAAQAPRRDVRGRARPSGAPGRRAATRGGPRGSGRGRGRASGRPALGSEPDLRGGPRIRLVVRQVPTSEKTEYPA